MAYLPTPPDPPVPVGTLVGEFDGWSVGIDVGDSVGDASTGIDVGVFVEDVG